MIDQEGKEKANKSLCVILNLIVDTFLSVDADNETTSIILKDSQLSTTISTIYIPPASLINTTLLNNMKNSMDNINITTRDSK